MTKRSLLLALASLLVAGPVAAAPVEVSGRVVTTDGEGLAGAGLELRPLTSFDVLARRQLAAEVETPRPAATARSDRTGAYRLVVPRPGFWQLVVRRPGYLPARFDLSPLTVTRELPEVALERRSELLVQLRDDRDRPFGDVVLAGRGWSHRWRQLALVGWWPQDRYVESGPDGVARMPCGVDEKVSLAAVRGEHYLYQTVSCRDGKVGLQLADRLSAALLVDAEGAPVEGAPGFVHWPLLAFGVSDDEGRIRGPWRPEDPVRLAFADARGFLGEPSLGITEAGSEQVPVFQLTPGEMLTGVVLDAVSGDPVAGAWLWTGRGSHHFQVTGPEGVFRWRLPAERPSTEAVRVGGEDYLESLIEGPRRRGETGHHRGGLVVRLAPALSRRGRVVDAAGEGIADAEISSRPARYATSREDVRRLQGDHRWALGPAAVHSDVNGAFELPRLAPRVPLELRVVRSGYATHTVRVEGPWPGDAGDELVITLQSARVGFGLVLDDGGQQVEAAQVELLPTLVGPGRDLDYGGGESYAATTDAEGVFEIPDLPAGTYYLAARTSDHPEVLVPGVEVPTGAGAFDLGTVTLSPGILLRGRIRDGGGEAVAGATAQIRSADGDQIVVQRRGSVWFDRATSHSDGTFELSGLPSDSRLTLLAVAEGFLPLEVRVTTGDEDLDLDLVLEVGARFRGRVVDGRGNATALATVKLRRINSDVGTRELTTESRTVTSDFEGRFEIDRLRPGTYEVGARHQGSLAGPVRRELTAAGVEDLVLVLEARASVEGLVLDPEGLPFEGAWVVMHLQADVGATSAEPYHFDQTRSDADGSFRLQAVRPGRYRLTARGKSYEPATAEVEVGDATGPAVVLRFEERSDPRRHRVSGWVVDASGQAVSGAEINLVGAPRGARAVSRGDGTFELQSAAGEFRLICYREGYARHIGETLHVDGDVTGLVVELSQGAVVTGTLSGLAPEDLPRVVVTARGGFDHQYGTINYRGEIRIPLLSPGEWTVRAELLNPSRSASQQIQIAEGDREVRVDLHFESGARLGGIAYRAGLPLVGGTVEVRCTGEFRGEAFTDADGRFAIDDVPAGACTATLRDDRGTGNARLELVVDGDTDIVLEMPAPQH